MTEKLVQLCNDITTINENSKSFDFLKDEPEIYSLSDLKEIYV
jgi:hypothetical protein